MYENQLGSRKDNIWKVISYGSCANGSEQSDGQFRCQLSAVNNDKRCHWVPEQEFLENKTKII